MFIPKLRSLKFKIRQSYKSSKYSIKSSQFIYGNCAIISKSYSIITYNHLENLRRFISRRINKKRKKLVRVSLTHILFKKPLKSRMGKGVGKFYKWYGYIKPGQILFEFIYLGNIVKLREKFNSFRIKLPFKLYLKNINYRIYEKKIS